MEVSDDMEERTEVLARGEGGGLNGLGELGQSLLDEFHGVGVSGGDEGQEVSSVGRLELVRVVSEISEVELVKKLVVVKRRIVLAARSESLAAIEYVMMMGWSERVWERRYETLSSRQI